MPGGSFSLQAGQNMLINPTGNNIWVNPDGLGFRLGERRTPSTWRVAH